MDDDGGLGIRNWGYYEQSLKGTLGLQLMSSVGDRDTKPLLSNGGFFHRDCGIGEPSVPMGLVRDGWIHHARDIKNPHMLPMNHHHLSSYGVLPGTPTPTPPHTLQMMQPPPQPQQQQQQPKDERIPLEDDPGGRNDTPLKKRPQGNLQKSPKPKKPKKTVVPRDESGNGSVSRGKAGRKSMGMVINGIDLDLSRIPTPVCSCTGTPQQCYRWGAGGWQSACCTTSISEFPLPMSQKRRGARIAGRKMSQGAFKKVLEKLAGEGYNLSNPIDLRTFWAKHGTNKFVTIR